MSPAQITPIVAITTLIALSVLGGLGASAGGADMARGAIPVSFGALSPWQVTAVSMLVGVTVG